jgi:hypothetical protein
MSDRNISILTSYLKQKSNEQQSREKTVLSCKLRRICISLLRSRYVNLEFLYRANLTVSYSKVQRVCITSEEKTVTETCLLTQITLGDATASQI